MQHRSPQPPMPMLIPWRQYQACPKCRGYAVESQHCHVCEGTGVSYTTQTPTIR